MREFDFFQEMAEREDNDYALAINREPHIRSRQLELMKSFLLKSEGKTSSATFNFILAQLPTNAVFRELVKHLEFEEDKDLLPGRIAGKLHSEWYRTRGRPGYRDVLLRLMDQTIEKLKHSGKSAFRLRLDELRDLFKLSDDDIACIETVFFISTDDDFQDAIDGTDYGASRRATYLSRILWPQGISPSRALTIAGRLRALGIMDTDFDLEKHVSDYLTGMSDDPLSASYFQPGAKSALSVANFNSLQEDVEFLAELIRGRHPDHPLHILFYGRPGTGKTALAQALAKDLDRQLYEIQHYRDEYRHRRNDSPNFRMAALKACTNAVDTEHSVILIDEADDLLNDECGYGEHSHKAAVNNLLDHTCGVCIWVTNHFHNIDPSTRRRFDYSLEFKDLSLQQREAVWRTCLKREGLNKGLTRAERGALARSFRVNAGAIDFAVRNAKRCGSDAELKPTLERFLEQHLKLMHNGTQRKPSTVARQYTLQGLNIQGDLDAPACTKLLKQFHRQLRRDPDNPALPRNMNLLMYGPPGTGKTEFAKYLAQKLGCQLSIKTAADILNCFVGGTEAKIRAAFKEAEREEAILFFDEIDGLLSDRSHANRSWEVTQVNELLTCLENFRGIFLAATNFRARVDRASIRRFNLKLQFDYLENHGKRVFWRRYLKPLTDKRLSRANARALDALPLLAPGDFKVVQQKYAMFPEGNYSNATLIDALAEEVHHKQNGKPTNIGFGQ